MWKQPYSNDNNDSKRGYSIYLHARLKGKEN